MGKLTRFGVSLDEDLLQPFDALCQRKGYSNRSEANRDLIRKDILEERWNDEVCAAGTLSLVYDHHRNDLPTRLMNIQHEDFECIVTSLHVHLDHDNCLEVLILKGTPSRVRELANKLISCTGVKHGVFTPTTTGQNLP